MKLSCKDEKHLIESIGNEVFYHSCYLCGKVNTELADAEEHDPDGNKIRFCKECLLKLLEVFPNG